MNERPHRPPLAVRVHRKQLATMVVVRDRETPENADGGGCKCEQKRVDGDGQDKDNDHTARDQDYEARVQREQFRVVV